MARPRKTALKKVSVNKTDQKTAVKTTPQAAVTRQTSADRPGTISDRSADTGPGFELATQLDRDVQLDSDMRHDSGSRHDEKQLVILTGLSGSGKASALKAFEDLGFYSVDNLPVELLPRFAELVAQSVEITRAALVVDVRE